ncbi:MULTISPECIES: DUF2087 domain-containing protein [unclassified Ruegeria]|uniref:DUF2087 domain-containing protein n=1 Tax=unclassified Ruegeria TaxID=2625375 RepID=UPI0014880DE6|nr:MULTISPECIES: DUF2087 domain-containing protein [unclassified Ruegeria]NOD75173.1 DUF2087 domain-containing protein [Ruegeria sp. HKCCD4332]NOD87134.1 DUF2087 domain-containing protein [Ruegeria sp. HKCCD4318]NOE12689.1 DUF2087 domain-containing protein [Ruegeria sp. HKCCD4318-2]NOG09146.1 DUF2087 domain-containing protein [Ruegeria sp. HKCCD4315]
MSKTPVPLHIDDLTPFVRTLSNQLGAASPSHLTLMNMVARAAGFQNVQHMRADSAANRRLQNRSDPPAPNARLVERTLHLFDTEGRLRQWPSKRSVQTLSLWALWAAVPTGKTLHEAKVNACLNAEHCFDDPATLRRTMISCGLLTRRKDGSEYRRVEQEPPVDAKQVIHDIARRRRERSQ